MVSELHHPVGGMDYPRTLQEFNGWFLSEAACLDYLRQLRWPDGFRCPVCNWRKAWATARGQFRCVVCQRQTSPIAGTIFEGTRKPLRTWFQAMWFVTNQKLGGSALGLQRILGLGSYQTAWSWLHKMRRAMVLPGRERLSGCVEVDETCVGGHEEGVSGRKTKTKSIVVIAAEEKGRGIGRIRLQRIPDVSAARLIPFLQEAVRPGSVIHTDGWGGYNDIQAKGYTHKVTDIDRSEQLAHELMPRVDRVAVLIKRWILGTHQGSVSDKHLDYYLDEFTFRYNHRHSRARGLLFYRLLQQALRVAPVPYRCLVGRKRRT